MNCIYCHQPGVYQTQDHQPHKIANVICYDCKVMFLVDNYNEPWSITLCDGVPGITKTTKSIDISVHGQYIKYRVGFGVALKLNTLFWITPSNFDYWTNKFDKLIILS